MQRSASLTVLLALLGTAPVALAGAPASSATPGPLQKISIVESSNLKLDDGYRTLRLPESPDSPELRQLRDHVLKQVDLLGRADPELIFAALEWVSIQWDHDGLNQPPPGTSSFQILQNVEQGQRYRCVEYGTVVSDLLLSLGYPSRRLGIKSVDAAYGGFGQGHVASEVWSNTLDKWIFIDPQFSMAATHEGRYLSFHEMYQLKREGRFNEIRFTPSPRFVERHKTTPEELEKQYRAFIGHYFGYMEIPYQREGKKASLILPLEGKGQFATFQGLPIDGLLFTDDPRELYFPLNHTQVLFTYNNARPFIDVIREHGITTEQQFLSKRPRFAARPDYTLTFQQGMPWFAHYELRVDGGEWKRVPGDTVPLKLHAGLNTLEVRAVNRAGAAGPINRMKLRYAADP
ncbi:hypothetical protein HPC49_33730 [Pyxidicoccus fallax]|uniref:Transglutaminase-like domain-containing protein n=2 Tax=Pyxidicoccus fallax TaxID=394095 RepID=A0A848LPM1_9BACT|nr:hypothetical protein [Pyxidicoccus fallax]NMO19835.1 hypothetical protein [Pyxidicoccus fallax]NPC83169.1 hypothetical protein [Pyxidicoccus fallax]